MKNDLIYIKSSHHQCPNSIFDLFDDKRRDKPVLKQVCLLLPNRDRKDIFHFYRMTSNSHISFSQVAVSPQCR